MRVATCSSIAERAKEVAEGLIKHQTIEDITIMIKTLPNTDDFITELTRKRRCRTAYLGNTGASQEV